MTQPRALAVGGVLLDSVITATGRINEGAMGGNAVYAACAMRLWLPAGEVAIIGHIPANYPAAHIERLAAAGIVTDAITRVSTPVAGPEWFIYHEDGSRHDEITRAPILPDAPSFPQFRRSHPIRLDDIPPKWRATIQGAHLTGGPVQEISQIVTALQTKYLTLDPGARVADLAPALLNGVLMAGISAFLPSQKELTHLFPDTDPANALHEIIARGAGIALVKQGAAGVLLKTQDTPARLVSALPTQVVDPTGAGDSFCGGFLAGLILGRDSVTCACMGIVSASFAINAFGPDALMAASQAEISRRLADVQTMAGTIQHEQK